jgi:predicted PurR-regulated permease PerM
MVGTLVCVALGSPIVAGLFLSVPVMAVAKALIETSKPAPSASNLVSTVQPQAVPEQQSGSPAQSAD